MQQGFGKTDSGIQVAGGDDIIQNTIVREDLVGLKGPHDSRVGDNMGAFPGEIGFVKK